MKFLKWIIIIVVSVIAMLLVVALFVKKEYAVEKEVIVNKPKDEVFNYIKYLENQDDFSKWAQMDPEMKKTYTGTDGEVGFVSAWKSNKKEVGEGVQKIINIEDGERIDYELHFIKPFESTEQAYLTTESITESETKIKWGFKGHMSYPMNIMLLCMDMENMIGNDLQEGLNNLKSNLESTPLH